MVLSRGEVRVRGIVALLSFAVAVAGVIGNARASVYADAPTAVIALAPQVTPGDRLEGDFSVLMWIWPETEITSSVNIFEIPGLLGIGTDVSGQLTTTLEVFDTGGVQHSLSATTAAPLVAGQWQLIGVSYRQAGYLNVFHAWSGGSHSGEQVVGVPAAPITVDAGAPRLGAGSDGTPAMVGAYGLLVVRSHPTKLNDITGIFATHRLFAPYDMESAGGLMNGVAGAEWMLNHAVTTLPTDVDAGGLTFQRAAVMGGPVGVHNVHVYDKRDDVVEEFERFNRVRQADEVHGFRYASTREAPLDDFFIIDPGQFAVVFPSVPGVSPLAAQLAGHARRPIRVFISSNSRAVFRDDGSGESPGNYAHGFFDIKRSEVAGVLFRPVVRGGGGPWFGLDCTNSPRSTLTELIDTAAGSFASFARFWTGSARATAAGPGGGVFLNRWGTYGLRCGPEEGSLLTADAPLVVEAHVMAFPGASVLQWKPTRGIWQNELGIDDGPLEQIELDTTRHVHTFAADDRVLNNTAIVLKGQFAGLVQPGDAMFISTGPAAGQINIIASVTQGISQANITFTRNLIEWPETGATLNFGPWRFETVRHEFPPVPEGDSHVWRGLYLSAINNGAGFPVFAFSAYRPNTNGYLIGVAGWGGNGYLPQLLDCEPDAMREWVRVADPDLWIQVPAQQNTLPEQMADYTEALRDGKPDCEIVWAGEAAHPSGVQFGWPEYISGHAAENGVVGVVAYNRRGIGTELEQLADGHRSNLAHISRRGNQELAKVWCALLSDAAIDPCPADFAEPWNQYDFFDVQRFLAAFASEQPVADLTDDGMWDFFDIQRFLNLFTAGCP